MKEKRNNLIYLFITIIFIIIAIIFLLTTNLISDVALSKTIQIVLILFLIKISIGCALFIRKQYKKQKYSYSIIMNL